MGTIRNMSNVAKELNGHSAESKDNSLILDLQTLHMFAMFTMSDNTKIRMSNYSALRSFMNSLNLKLYVSEPEKMKYINFVNRALECILDRKIGNNKDMLMQYVNGSNGEKPLLDFKISELSNSEIDYVNNIISELSKSMFMYSYADSIMEVCQRFKTDSYIKRGEISAEFESLVDDVKKEFRRVNSELSTELDFSLDKNSVRDRVEDIYRKEINPSRTLVCGMQGLNRMNGGGFESGRVYMFFGTAASGKSFTTLDIALQVKMYNNNYKCHDKTKKPCIVILTMENSTQETVSRIYSMLSMNRMKDSSMEDVLRLFETDPHLNMEYNDINIIIKYKPNLSVDTSYLYTMYEDLLEEGYEPMMIIQDHIKRIKPAYSQRDLRLDLGEIVNEFKAFAVEKDLVFLSISHLNREAAKTLEEAKRTNKSDVGKLLGRSNVSESMLMIDNCDVGYIITKDYNREGSMFLAFTLIRTRTQFEFDYFCQPFVPGNDVKLVEDMNRYPAYLTTLSDNPYDNKGTRSYNGFGESDYLSGIKHIQEEEDDETPYGGKKLKCLENLDTAYIVDEDMYNNQDDDDHYDDNGNIITLDSLEGRPLYTPPQPMIEGIFFVNQNYA